MLIISEEYGEQLSQFNILGCDISYKEEKNFTKRIADDDGLWETKSEKKR